MEEAYKELNWEWDYQEEDQRKLAQFHSILELETRIACVHKEIARKSDEMLNYKRLLTKTINDRDNFQLKCRILSKDLVSQHETKKNEDGASIIRTSYIEDNFIIKLDKTVLAKRLPDKGKFLQAVMDAGPLLQTLLFVGQLPRWQHAPPKRNAIKNPTTTCIPPLSSTTSRPI
ncbi:uncharacterized protein LOC143569287 [Bidens hawaiensis]|uniref:uncharacterized protein LOC143569287 n=1 Tax=Bidens hawaiensis TaxID=980011 RepID=UPI00404B1E92